MAGGQTAVKEEIYKAMGYMFIKTHLIKTNSLSFKS